jgi:hypothetical protein
MTGEPDGPVGRARQGAMTLTGDGADAGADAAAGERADGAAGAASAAFPPYRPEGRVCRFESAAVAEFARLAGCASVLELPGRGRPPLDLSSAPGVRLVPAPLCAEAAPDGAFPPERRPAASPAGSLPRPAAAIPGLSPAADLAVSRRFGDPRLPPPSLEEAESELARLFSLAGKHAAILYPSRARPGIGEAASGLRGRFTLEGLLPHRYPKTFHDSGEAASGDLYIFCADGHSVPAPFRAGGGRHSARLPVKSPSGLPEDSESLRLEIRELAARKKLGEAVPRLARLSRMLPEEPRLRLNLGYFLLGVESCQEAAEAFRSVLAEDPECGEARLALAGIHLHLKDYASLRAFLPELMMLRPSSARVSEAWPEIRKAFMDLEARP